MVDDDPTVVASLGVLLETSGFEVSRTSSPDQALDRLGRERLDLVLQDMNFSRETSGDEGLKLLSRIKAEKPGLPVVLMTAWGSIELAVRGMKLGAADFISKPWTNGHLLSAIETTLALSQVAETPEVTPSREELEERMDLGGLVGRDPAFLEVLSLVGRVAVTNASVLILGESGTGKELVAAAVHANSPRREAPFVKVNLGGISSTLFESEMFGHVRGAFTDARKDRRGRFAVADGGTIFLDEIGDVDLSSQVKLLRVLQDRTFEVLGSSEPKTVDVRVVSATNADLSEMVRNGQFREDLLYRLNLITIRLPALRDRREDIPTLASAVLSNACAEYRVESRKISSGGMNWLKKQPWPGNVRQLVQAVERAVLVLPEGEITASSLESLSDRPDDGGVGLPRPGRMTLSEVERRMIAEALDYYQGNLTRVAEALGLTRQALYRRLDKYGLASKLDGGSRPE